MPQMLRVVLLIWQVQSWMADWEAQAARAHEAVGALASSSGEYRFAENNAFLDVRTRTTPSPTQNPCLLCMLGVGGRRVPLLYAGWTASLFTPQCSCAD